MSGPPIDGETRIYGVLGHPVRASLSPAMHNAGFQALGINAVYVAFPLVPSRFEEGIRGLQASGIAGFNLTVPHKTAILPLLNDLSPQAQAVGAANTVRCEGVHMHGTNTDGQGFLDSLQEHLNWAPRGKTVLLLGAGGAARAIAYSLLDAGAAHLTIANRTHDRATALAREMAAGFKNATVMALEMEQLEGLAPQLLVNATTVGMGDGASPVVLKALGVTDGVIDIVYTPAHTPLLEQAQALDLPQTNGIGMLLHQGCLAFEFWTGRDAPVEVMRQALLAGLAARGG